MCSRTRTFLIALLVLLIGVGPSGSAMAALPHVCAADAAQAMPATGVSLGEHVHHAAMAQDGAPQSNPDCTDCDAGCCQSGLCSMNQCGGTTAALQAFSAHAFERIAVVAMATTAAQLISGRFTPPFRPPQG